MKTLLTIFLALIALFCGGCSLTFLISGLGQSWNAQYTGLNFIYPILLAGFAIAAMAITAIVIARNLGKPGIRHAKAKTYVLAALVALLTLGAVLGITSFLFNWMSWIFALGMASLAFFETRRLYADAGNEGPKS